MRFRIGELKEVLKDIPDDYYLSIDFGDEAEEIDVMDAACFARLFTLGYNLNKYY